MLTWAIIAGVLVSNLGVSVWPWSAPRVGCGEIGVAFLGFSVSCTAIAALDPRSS
jgi:hypothetical protein